MRGPLPAELYLRTIQFELPGLDNWSRAQPNANDPISPTSIRHRGEIQAGIPVRELRIETVPEAEHYLFLPPGTVGVDGLGSAIGNLARESIFRTNNRPADYSVRYQDRRPAILDLPADLNNNLTRLPDELQPHLDLFYDILRRSGVRTATQAPAEIAARIITTLQKDCRYELREPGGDFGYSLLNFIAGERTGFCMHFSSALAIALRIAGIPSRIGAGLYTNVSPLEAGGTIRLGSQHAHAWVEVPIEGLGWVIFDPTPPDFEADMTSTDQQEGTDTAASDTAFGRWIDGRMLAIALLTVSLTGLLLHLRRRIRIATDAKAKTSSQRHIDPSARDSFRNLLKAIEHWRTWHPGHESLQEHLAELRHHQELPLDQVASAFRAYEDVRFGDHPFDESRATRIREAVRSVRALQEHS